ncbi:MAG TPA: pantoate--beta-alanine ligase [Solirubrobacterales bacterium]|nr:pantoate--beta-alanine ligase [Solirubrobacterales bacterium]
MDLRQMSISPGETVTKNAAARVLRGVDELRSALIPARRAGRTIGLVPTMGFLHDGHVSLLRAARAECDVVVMSLFVNPTQFGPNEDLDRYPRDEERDLRLAGAAGVDLVFAPEVAEMYPDGAATAVEVGGNLTSVLDGDPSRRGASHFRGVTTIVAKLFNIVGPDVAYFGQKDAQQAAVIKRMARDLSFPLRVEVMPTVREEDGLAMSSRNVYLGAADRLRAVAISRALAAAEQQALALDSLDAGLAAARIELGAAAIEPEYLEARDAETLEPAERLRAGRPVLIAVAAQVGGARLIDNVLVEPIAD